MNQILEEYKIFNGDKEYPASKYQVEIFKNIQKGVNNLIINASAGSSKTSTIVNSLRFIPEKKKILFVAFNKDIVEKIKLEVEHPNATISTFHSLGLSILTEQIQTVARDNHLLYKLDDLLKLDIYKYNNYINTIISNNIVPDISGRKKEQYLNNIKKLVDYSRYYLAFTEKEISKVANLYGVVAISNEYAVTKDILLWGKENITSIDYTDMIWLPNVLNLTTKKHLYDWIFIDEAQDTSIAEQGLIEKCFKRGAKFVAVGDEFQQINIFAGATQEAIELFKKHPNTITLSLPISYRCPKKIVELASKYSNNIFAADNAIDGEINYEVSPCQPKINDMILCRTTAPLVELYLKYINEGKKCFIRGNENIKESYLSLISNTKSTLIDKNCVTPDGLIPKLYISLFDLIEKLKENGLTDDDIYSNPSVISLYDNIDAIIVLSNGFITVNELTERINTVFNGEEGDGIQLSTVHKAKGLEADNVFIYYPSLMPLKLANKSWEYKTEDNLIYVAYTRAKKTLNFIKEDKHNSRINNCSNSQKLKENLETIKKKILYSKELGITEKNFSKTPEKLKIKLGETVIDKQNISKKTKAGIKMRNLL